MLTITVLGKEYWDEQAQEFFTRDDVVLELEHSLVSLSKWESKWEIPFLGPKDKTTEQVLSYIEMMTLTPISSGEVFHRLSQDNVSEINTYLDAKMTATWFADTPNAPRTGEVITAELIYYWMTAFQIPFECQYWHLNKLFTLIKIANLKNAKPKKMSRADVAQRNRELNEQRKAEFGTNG